jgi:hypothetical protein
MLFTLALDQSYELNFHEDSVLYQLYLSYIILLIFDITHPLLN